MLELGHAPILLFPGRPDCPARPAVLRAGGRIPDGHVWVAPGEDPRPLPEVLGAGLSLLCFYVWDWAQLVHRQ